MYEVNRSVVTAVPQAPFWRWLEALPSEGFGDIGRQRQDFIPNAYLIAPCDSDEELLLQLEGCFADIFAAELADWCEDESLWPEQTWPAFLEWFDIRFSAVVSDLLKDGLERETFVPFTVN